MRSKKKCRNCGKYFLPDKFNYYHQNYCSNSECRQASRKASKAKSRKAQSLSLDFRKKESERVKKWQAQNPGYWKERKKKIKKRSEKVPEGKVLLDVALVEKMCRDMSDLRDVTFSQYITMEGVISVLTSDVLRDNIGVQRNRLYDRGREISGKETEMDIINKNKQMRLRYETQNANRSSPQA